MISSPLLSLTEAPAAALVQAFLAGRNPRTLAAYRTDLAAFAAFLGAVNAEGAAWMLLTRAAGEANQVALAWRASMVERGLAAATVNRRLAAVRSMVKLARTLGLVAWVIEVEGVEAQPYRDTRGPGAAGWQRIRAAATTRTDPKGLRDLALLRLLHDMALRRGEVAGLDMEHLDLAGARLAVLGKGRTGREWLTVPAQTLASLAAWLNARGSQPGPLFTSFDRAGKGSGRITGAGMFSVVRAAGDAAGVKVRPHGLRHAGITAALDATGGNIRKVQRYSRHRDMRTLEIYDDSRQDMAGEVAALVAAG